MKRPSDTSPEAQRVLTEVYRAMTPTRKWTLLGDLYRFGRQLHAAGVRLRRPDASSIEIRDDWLAQHATPLPVSFARRTDSEMNQPIEHERVILEVVAVFDSLRIAYALVGSLASSLYGYTRLTADADIMVSSFEGKEDELIRSFGPDYYVSLDGIRRALRERSTFNIINSIIGFKIDIFIQRDRPFDRSIMQRRAPSLPSSTAARPLSFVTAEDIVLLKLEWFRHGGETSDNQWSDILGVLRTQSELLDKTYLNYWAKELGVEDLLAKAIQETLA